jgi:hypothetical protein
MGKIRKVTTVYKEQKIGLNLVKIKIKYSYNMSRRYNRKEIEEFVYNYLRKNEIITPIELSKKIGMTWKNAYLILGKFVEQGKIRRIGRAYLLNKKD